MYQGHEQRISPCGAGTPENLPLGISLPDSTRSVCSLCKGRVHLCKSSCKVFADSDFPVSLTSSSVLFRGPGELRIRSDVWLHVMAHGTARFVTRRFAMRLRVGSKPSMRCIRCTLLLKPGTTCGPALCATFGSRKGFTFGF